jgi:uncharacterized protein (DUF2062 family)
MNAEESELRKTRRNRVRRVKWWLRPLPRRSNIHRYPILSLFATAAKKRIYLWSFRVECAVPAIYGGCILTLLPLYGVQLPLSFLLALLLRANLPILAGLQILSNPFTVLPIWFAAYQIGRHFLGVIGVEAAPLARSEVQTLLYNFTHAQWGENINRLFTVFGVTALGSIIMGTFFGLIGAFIYRMVARRTAASYAALKEKIHHHRLRKPGSPLDSDHDSRD